MEGQLTPLHHGIASQCLSSRTAECVESLQPANNPRRDPGSPFPFVLKIWLHYSTWCNQELIDIARKDCRHSLARVADLALFSPNETLDDISTQDLVYLFIPYVAAEIESRARAIERDERLTRLREAEVRPCLTIVSNTTPPQYGQQGFTKFVSDIELYEIASKSERDLYGKNASAIADPARRRETKIKQYQAEKDIRSRIEVWKFSISSPHARTNS